MERILYIAAGVLGAVGVGAGAFGAHGLKNYFAEHPDLHEHFKTAVFYHMVHTMAVIASAWAISKWNAAPGRWAGVLFIAGIVIFSGSLYCLSLTGVRRWGAITPIGGIAFIAAWLCLALSVRSSAD